MRCEASFRRQALPLPARKREEPTPWNGPGRRRSRRAASPSKPRGSDERGATRRGGAVPLATTPRLRRRRRAVERLAVRATATLERASDTTRRGARCRFGVGPRHYRRKRVALTPWNGPGRRRSRRAASPSKPRGSDERGATRRGGVVPLAATPRYRRRRRDAERLGPSYVATSVPLEPPTPLLAERSVASASGRATSGAEARGTVARDRSARRAAAFAHIRRCNDEINFTHSSTAAAARPTRPRGARGRGRGATCARALCDLLARRAWRAPAS